MAEPLFLKKYNGVSVCCALALARHGALQDKVKENFPHK
jgi:hypothetical protein